MEGFRDHTRVQSFHAVFKKPIHSSIHSPFHVLRKDSLDASYVRSITLDAGDKVVMMSQIFCLHGAFMLIRSRKNKYMYKHNYRLQ